MANLTEEEPIVMNNDESERGSLPVGLIDDVGAGAAAAPGSMTDEEVTKTRQQATEMVRSMCESTGARRMAVLDEVGTMGLQSQRNAARQLELVKTRMGTLLDGGGSSRDVATGMAALRTALDRINPHLEQKSLWSRTIGALPFVRDNALVRALKKIAMRYEPVSKQIVVIETKLREGRSLLGRDNIELRRLYEDVETQQESIQRQIFLGELLLVELRKAAAGTDDPRQREAIQTATHDVAIRVQDLRTMNEVHLQFFVSIELTRTNNTHLAQAVDRTLTLATNVVTVGLAIQAALARQRAVQEATQRTREYLGEVITQNAAAIRQQTEEIGNLYNEPIIAMDKLVQAHHDLLVALDEASSVRERGIQTALANIEQLTSLTSELSEHVQGLENDDQGRRP